MKKYIEAEKLIAEIKRFRATEYGDNTFGDDVANGALDYVLEEIIPSLQQEQPEVDLEKEIEWEWVHREKQEVDLIECAEMHNEEFVRFARHFYELGLNARKK